MHRLVHVPAEKLLLRPAQHPRRGPVDEGEAALLIGGVQAVCHVVHDDGAELLRLLRHADPLRTHHREPTPSQPIGLYG